MDELMKYFQQIESRLAALEAAEQAEPAQDAKLAELAALVAVLTQKLTLAEAKNTNLENLVAGLQNETEALRSQLAELAARPAQIVEKVVEVAAPVSLAESEEVKLDEESGQPELEVELVEDDTINESEEVATDEESGEPELVVELVDEPEEEVSEPEPVVEPEPVAEPEPIVEPVAEPSEEPVVEPVVEVAEEAPKAEEAPAPTVLDAAQQNVISSVVPKLADLKKGITMGDRFLFQRELFGNNGELMSKTIEALNALPSLADAEAYIQRFNWNKESNAYELFVNLLKRRW